MSLAIHAAPGSSAGFTFQFDRALYHLASNPAGSAVGIETYDDVSVERPDESLLLEQAKHSIQPTGRPLGNRSHDLWNTLAIWIEALEQGEISSERTEFLFVTNKVLGACLASQIGEAKTDAEIEECVRALQAAGENPAAGVAEAVKYVLAPERRVTLKTVISKTNFEDGSNRSAGAGLRAKTLANLQFPTRHADSSESILDELAGWLQRTALEKWQRGEPAWILRDVFVNQFHAILRRQARQRARERAENLISVPEANVSAQRGSVFVKQLHLVTEEPAAVDAAIEDFIRSKIEKVRLSEEGDVTDQDWLEFESSLKRRWESIFSRVKRMARNEAEEDIGFKVLRETTENYRERLAGSETDHAYLTSGAYHSLADSVTVGWHPRFREILKPSL